ncbi:hypothetical protein J2X48_000721 [Bosea sp. BE271]|nr:hypothetical protein [Bosea robiniae]MDR6893185.1 hypothetical protein [Bosea sp. BE109]MDR7137116.1 hypothetical protein [Bosea sp. BE168]MDR7173815.1 hypothetical protein [Bosea sp. BE271]
MPLKNMLGLRFGRLLVSSQAPSIGRDAVWLCVCDCGAETKVRGRCLRSGETQSCGCYGRQSATRAVTKHAMRGKPEYAIWCGMKARCHNEKNPAYPRYGGRGIKVCPEWQSFETFYADMGDRPSEAHSLDRVDTNEGYSRQNCRWATATQQARNTRRNLILTVDSESHPISVWAELTGIKYGTLISRFKRGWDPSKIVSSRTG